MSLLDTVLADTVGVGWRAVTGTVDPWTKQQIVDDTTASTTHSLDVAQANGYDITDAQIAAYAAGNDTAITQTLKTTPGGSSDPTDAGVHIPGLGNIGSTDFLANVNKFVDIAILIGVALIFFWIYQNYGGTLRREFRRK